MGIRPFDWRDLQQLHRHRHHSVFLYSALVLTRGPLLVPGALLSYLAPSMGIVTAAAEAEKKKEFCLIGQIIQSNGSPYAYLTFLTPVSALDSPRLPPLLDYLAVQAGEHGAFRLLADVGERNLAFEALRNASFAIYARQRIWQLKGTERNPAYPPGWRVATDQDAQAVRHLYNDLAPGLVQQIEPVLTEYPRGLVFCQDDNLLAYVEMRYGGRGIWAQPFVHPDAVSIALKLGDLLLNLPGRQSRPVYVCIRSYQSWLESVLEELGAEPGPRQAVMVKHLAVAQKAMRPYAIPAIESGQAEVTAPISQMEPGDYGTTNNR